MYDNIINIVIEYSELFTDWIIALSMAWGAFMFTVLGIVFLILYARGKNEKVHFELPDTDGATPVRVRVKDIFSNPKRIHPYNPFRYSDND